MTPRDWTLLVIAAADPKPLQPVQLQKSIFLLGRNLSSAQLQVKEFYQFQPYDYGPFCSDIYSDAEKLSDEGLIRIDPPLSLSYQQYHITDQGRTKAAQLRAKLPKKVTSYLGAVVTWVTALPFSRLISAIYKAYPEMKVNSVFKD